MCAAICWAKKESRVPTSSCHCSIGTSLHLTSLSLPAYLVVTFGSLSSEALPFITYILSISSSFPFSPSPFLPPSLSLSLSLSLFLSILCPYLRSSFQHRRMTHQNTETASLATTKGALEPLPPDKTAGLSTGAGHEISSDESEGSEEETGLHKDPSQRQRQQNATFQAL